MGIYGIIFYFRCFVVSSGTLSSRDFCLSSTCWSSPYYMRWQMRFSAEYLRLFQESFKKSSAVKGRKEARESFFSKIQNSFHILGEKYSEP